VSCAAVAQYEQVAVRQILQGTRMSTTAKYGGIQDAATIIGCSEKTIRRRISDGSIPAYRMPGKSKIIRIRLDELEAALVPVPNGAVAGDRR